jgi:predicted RNase H-like HicB family nuclease
MKFNVTIDRDEDGAWIVECPSIPGCVSQGETRKDALINIDGTPYLRLQPASGLIG